MRVRIVQMFFVGLCCLGVSWALCDLAAAYRELLQISPISVGMMSYGAMGAAFMEVVARRLGGVRQVERTKDFSVGVACLVFVLVLVMVISSAAVIFPYSYGGIAAAQFLGERRQYTAGGSSKVAPLSEPYQTLPLIILVVAIAMFIFVMAGAAHGRAEKKGGIEVQSQASSTA